MGVTAKVRLHLRDQFVVRFIASRYVRPYLTGNNILPALVGTSVGGKT